MSRNQYEQVFDIAFAHDTMPTEEVDEVCKQIDMLVDRGIEVLAQTGVMARCMAEVVAEAANGHQRTIYTGISKEQFLNLVLIMTQQSDEIDLVVSLAHQLGFNRGLWMETFRRFLWWTREVESLTADIALGNGPTRKRSTGSYSEPLLEPEELKTQLWAPSAFLLQTSRREIWSVVDGYTSLRNRIVTAYLRLVAKVAKKRSRNGEQIKEMFQLGAQGVIRAVDMYTIGGPASFGVYAYFWVMQSISAGLSAVFTKESLSEAEYEQALSNASAVPSDGEYHDSYGQQLVGSAQFKPDQDTVASLLSLLGPLERLIVVTQFGLWSQLPDRIYPLHDSDRWHEAIRQMLTTTTQSC